ncbi:MAG: polyphosphate polymerase domain-containing protein [Phycisphaerales bacterium]|nr:MAG: polyphosphate polymerase domain-containing protein [Phycisphaerales bacterium]
MTAVATVAAATVAQQNGTVVLGPRLCWRRELKFPVPRYALRPLIADLNALLRPDAHVPAAGSYLVRSLYLDSPDFHSYVEKKLGASDRVKLRIRIYPPPRDAAVEDMGVIKFEIKHRRGEYVAKDVALADLRTYADLMPVVTRFSPIGTHCVSPPLARFLAVQRRDAMRPVLNIEFARHAFVWPAHRQLRVTVDERILAWRARDVLCDGGGAKRSVFAELGGILELKIRDAVPAEVERLVQKYRLSVRSLSKYAMAAPRAGIGLLA